MKYIAEPAQLRQTQRHIYRQDRERGRRCTALQQGTREKERGVGVGGGGGREREREREREIVCWLLNVPETCSCISGMDVLNFTCCHTEIEVADETFYLTQSQYTDTRLTSPSADPIMPG